MQFFKNLFRKKEDPEGTIKIEGVGSFDWDKESECWVGVYHGYKVSVSYDGFSIPTNDLTEYVAKTLKSPSFLERRIAEIKALAKEQNPVEKYTEIEGLEARDVVFQNPNFILIQFFGPEENEPFWFAEIHGSEIYVGYDT